jgi:hypothetical protein
MKLSKEDMWYIEYGSPVKVGWYVPLSRLREVVWETILECDKSSILAECNLVQLDITTTTHAEYMRMFRDKLKEKFGEVLE